MGDRPTTVLWGVGNRIAGRMAGLGIGTVRELAESPDGPLIGEFGPNTGPHLGRLGRGAGSAIVDDTPWVARAHGHETTYQRDLTSPEEVAGALRTLADQVVEDLQREGRGCARASRPEEHLECGRRCSGRLATSSMLEASHRTADGRGRDRERALTCPVREPVPVRTRSGQGSLNRMAGT